MGSAFSRNNVQGFYSPPLPPPNPQGPAGPSNAFTTSQLLIDSDLYAYLSGMTDAEKQAYASGNVNDVVRNVVGAKAYKFASDYSSATQADNNVVSATYYMARSNDLYTVADEMSTIAGNQSNSSDVTRGLVDRQYEINEWSNSNKLDTLYFLQILFICLTFVASMAFLKNNGILTQSLFVLFSIVAGLIAVMCLVLRARYTSVIRNPRYWNKVRFPSQPNTNTAVSATCG